MHDNKILKIVYTFFLGLLLALFVGVGINTFYPGPEYPQYPRYSQAVDKDLNEEQISSEQEYQSTMERFEKESKTYNRNVSIVALIASIALLAISLLFEKKIKVIADGVLLGGVFTLLYSIGRGFASENDQYVFLVITIGLGIALYLGYHRFVKSTATGKK